MNSSYYDFTTIIKQAFYNMILQYNLILHIVLSFKIFHRAFTNSTKPNTYQMSAKQVDPEKGLKEY